MGTVRDPGAEPFPGRAARLRARDADGIEALVTGEVADDLLQPAGARRQKSRSA